MEQPFDPKSYCETLLAFMKNAPLTLFFKDTHCRYTFVTKHCNMVYVDDDYILGKTDPEIQVNPEFGREYYEDDLNILRTGVGSQCISEIPTPEGVRYFEIRKNPVFIKGELVGIVGIVDEITERKRLEKEVERLTFHDSLTGLYNRNYLELHGKTYIEAAAYPISFIMADCNHLKETNDQQGHKAGDLLLQQTAQVLSRALPEGSLAVRMGGDEFLLLCPGCSAAQAETLIREMQTRLADASDAQLPLSAAFGASTLDSAPADAQGYQEAYQRADNAMYENKRSAR